MAGYRASDRRVEPFDVGDDDLSADDWIARRNEQISLRQPAELAGRQAWVHSIRTGQSVNAAQPGHIKKVGMQALKRPPIGANPSQGYNPNEPRDEHGRWTTGGAAASTTGRGTRDTRTISYGLLSTPAPSDQDLAELRRQQAALADITHKLDIQNSRFAAPALAAPLVILGLEGAAAWAARASLPEARQAVLDFVERDPYKPVGDNWATRAGRRAHAALEARLNGKDGWDYEPDLPRTGQRPLKPDAGTPIRDAQDPENPGKRYYLELKPNTPTGRAAAARAVKRYKAVTKDKVRPIYYDPKDFK